MRGRPRPLLPHLDLYGAAGEEDHGERAEPERVLCRLPVPEPAQPASQPESRPGAHWEITSINQYCRDVAGRAFVQLVFTVSYMCGGVRAVPALALLAGMLWLALVRATQGSAAALSLVLTA